VSADRLGWYYAYVLLGMGVALSLTDWACGFVRETCIPARPGGMITPSAKVKEQAAHRPKAESHMSCSV
jgi:hypothetical protein